MQRVTVQIVAGVSALALAACSSENPTEEATPVEDTAVETADVQESTETTAPDYSDLTTVIAADWRGDAPARDNWRNPAETLAFLEVDPSSTIVEIWPGGGWYADILAPWIHANGGTYIAAHFDANSPSENRQRSRAAFERRIGEIPAYGDVRVTSFSDSANGELEPGSVDTILTFRNVHNWMYYGFAERAFADFHAALKPGGTLGVVEHRLPSTREQDPGADTGYVQQAYVIALAEEAGFEFVGASEVNANPADTADHPFGVWTLPPVRQSAPRGEEPAEDFDRAGYDAIGESDRMTLLFRKPAED